jgi:hypothetical protein
MVFKIRSIVYHPPLDDLEKSRFYAVFVIPAKAGIQLNQAVLGSRLRGGDGFCDFLRDHPHSFAKMFLRFAGASGISPRIPPALKEAGSPKKSGNLPWNQRVPECVFPSKPAKAAGGSGNRLLPPGWIAS